MRPVIAIVLLVAAASAGASELTTIRIVPETDGTVLEFNLSARTRYQVFTMTSPDRVVVDFYGTRGAVALPSVPADEPVRRVRAARRNAVDYRVVFDVSGPFDVHDAWVDADAARAGARLRVELTRALAPAGAALPANAAAAAPVVPPPPAAQAAWQTAPARPIIVAIDAGHGGDDPGALGFRRTREKDITLAVARRLKGLIDREPGMRAVQVRDGDYYLGLRERMARARDRRADLFISIHADAFRSAKVQGASVYVLSQRGASSEAARWLAERENAADLVGGVSLQDKDELLRSVLLDLSQTKALEASVEVADEVLKELARLGKVHRRSVQSAGFMVLKSPDIPSILVETAFISNPREEQRLRSAAHQQSIAQAILGGVRAYFRSNPPPGTILAQANDARAASALLAERSTPDPTSH
jgi:N-acetylmuramoyl-L-alanine amidase